MESAVSQILRTVAPITSFPTALDDITETNMTVTETNMTVTETNASCEFSKIPSHPAFIFAYSLVFIVSLVLNCITVRVYFFSNQRVQSSVTVYMKNLAAADFFLCLCLPLRIANYANGSDIMRNIYCSFGATAFYLNMYASILFMDFIAANRYATHSSTYLNSPALREVCVCVCVRACAWLLLQNKP